MTIPYDDLAHGAVLRGIIRTLNKEYPKINYKFEFGKSTSAYILNIYSGSIFKKKITIALFMKFSRKRLSPWRFTFIKEHQEEIEKMHKKNNETIICLVNGEDGIAMIKYELLKKVLDDNFEEAEQISVSRKLKEYYRINGTDAKKKIPLAKNTFPNLIIEIIHKFK